MPALKCIFFILSLCMALPALAASDRIALVIGSSDYAFISKLRNTARDAELIAGSLRKIGFDVTTLVDAPRSEIEASMTKFAFQSETADLALIYYAGHGVSVGGQNFLIPVDAQITSNQDLPSRAIALDALLQTVDHARKMRIVILDSCRNNPFPGGLAEAPVSGARDVKIPEAGTAQTRGLAAGMSAPAPERGTLVAYAAKDGATAFDGDGDNSPFATALAEKLVQPGLEISLLFRQVRDEVMRATQSRQEPNVYGSLSGVPFYLAGSDEQLHQINSANRAEAWSHIHPDQEAQLAELARSGDTRAMLGLAYMRLYPDSPSYDPASAAALLQQAAAAGAPDAQFELARLYEKGLGVASDLPRALHLYQASAAQDYPDAINELGYFYFTGALGLQLDQAKALEMFAKAADLGQPEAIFNMASFIDDGQIPGSGPEQAGALLYKALRAGSEKVLQALTTQSDSFKLATRKAVQAKLRDNGFYTGPLDGAFGKGTLASIRRAYGLLPDNP
jgi:uncharacterized protein